MLAAQARLNLSLQEEVPELISVKQITPGDFNRQSLPYVNIIKGNFSLYLIMKNFEHTEKFKGI